MVATIATSERNRIGALAQAVAVEVRDGLRRGCRVVVPLFTLPAGAPREVYRAELRALLEPEEIERVRADVGDGISSRVEAL